MSQGKDMLDRDWLPNGAGLDRLLGKGESMQAFAMRVIGYLSQLTKKNTMKRTELSIITNININNDIFYFPILEWDGEGNKIPRQANKICLLAKACQRQFSSYPSLVRVRAPAKATKMNSSSLEDH